jgi:hypothetical protein
MTRCLTWQRFRKWPFPPEDPVGILEGNGHGKEPGRIHRT